MNAWIFFFLGMYHGINPGMGWLLATSIGFKQNSRRALVYALIALVLGHAVAIACVIFGIGWLKLYIPFKYIQYFTVFLLISLGVYHLYRHWHPKWMSLDVGYPTVFLWSFVIASAHGAGLMLIPFLGEGKNSNFLLLSSHVLGYVAASFLASFLLFETFKYTVLKKGWINFDLIWAFSLIITGAFFYLW